MRTFFEEGYRGTFEKLGLLTLIPTSRESAKDFGVGALKGSGIGAAGGAALGGIGGLIAGAVKRRRGVPLPKGMPLAALGLLKGTIGGGVGGGLVGANVGLIRGDLKRKRERAEQLEKLRQLREPLKV
ncbi:MAG: hypothetical protein DRP83_02285 [Planctomycetota bacterium]|nr:MAG: hypothetical protein DRP83_02285 [Planctomycetota bacterium]